MRFLIDMNLTPRWVHFFEEAGRACVHWSSLGPSDAPDADICAHAREEGYVLVTNDLDFPQILAYTEESKPSVILLRGQPLTPESRGSALLSRDRRLRSRPSRRGDSHRRLVRQTASSDFAAEIVAAELAGDRGRGRRRGALGVSGF